MKRYLPVLILLAVTIGATVGYFLRGQMASGQKSLGTAILRELSFDEFIASFHSSEWELVEDRVYDTFPPLSRNPAIARRIVAQSTLPITEQDSFARNFQTTADKWLTSHGAVIKGQDNASRNSTKAGADGQVNTLVDLPRRFYSVDNIHGVADFGCIVDSGRVTVIISISESD